MLRRINIWCLPESFCLRAVSRFSTEPQLGFRLSSGGETVFFKNPSNTRILDALQFEAQADGVSFGRYPDGASQLYPMASRTPGSSNSVTRVYDMVINELM